MVDKERVKNGLYNYLQRDVVPHLPADKQFIAGLAMGIAMKKSDQLMQTVMNHPVVKMLSIVDDQGMIDTDTVYNEAKKQMSAHGKLDIHLPLIGDMTFNSSDLDELYRYILS